MNERLSNDRPMNERLSRDRRGLTLPELLIVMLIVSVLAAIAQPQLMHLIVRARAADAISDMQVVRVAVYGYQADQQSWPSDVGPGSVPPGLDAYLPEGFNLVKENYTLDFENWGGTPFTVGISMITADSTLGRTALEMLASPKWTVGNRYTWVIE